MGAATGARAGTTAGDGSGAGARVGAGVGDGAGAATGVVTGKVADTGDCKNADSGVGVGCGSEEGAATVAASIPVADAVDRFSFALGARERFGGVGSGLMSSASSTLAPASCSSSRLDPRDDSGKRGIPEFPWLSCFACCETYVRSKQQLSRWKGLHVSNKRASVDERISRPVVVNTGNLLCQK